jgi:hypothetical protein
LGYSQTLRFTSGKEQFDGDRIHSELKAESPRSATVLRGARIKASEGATSAWKKGQILGMSDPSS